MADRTTYLAFDLGAESGRAVLGILADGRVELQEIHRFPNTPCLAGSHLHWDALYLFNEMKKGLAMAAARAPEGIASLGIDTWGVDFGLLDAKGELLSNPVHYRDARTNGILERAFEIVPRRDIFEQTGIQFLQFNSLFQLIAMREAGSPLLDAAENLLMMPDLFNYWFTGRMAREFTNATTTQCYDTRKNDWAWPLIDAFKLPRRIFGEVSAPATILAPTSDAIAAESGVRPIPVALPATHDTGSAVIAVPAEGENWAYISCGTWALIGVETSEPVINARSLEFNFTNEGGAFGTNRLLCNVMGLWLLQQSRRTWARGRAEPSYAEIVDAARNSPPLAAWIDPDDPLFFNPPDMVAAITQYCRRTNQEAPEGIGPVARCIIESLALKYRYKIERIEEMTGRTIAVIHIVGGGSRNELLCQATADACNRQVVAGPAEATALGNVLTQAAATGEMRGLDEIRAIVRVSSSLRLFDPNPSAQWDHAYLRFLRT